MAWTWDRIYRDSLYQAGILGEDQTLDPGMLEKARNASFMLLDELDGEGIALPVYTLSVEFTATAGVEKYILGTGSDSSRANAIRPETILTGTVQIATGPQPVFMTLAPITMKDFRKLSVPRTTSQPFNYAWNPSWPQGELYLYPVPAQNYPIKLTCKVKWVDVVGNPALNETAMAELPSGYTNAFMRILALRLAQPTRLWTDDMKTMASKAKYVMATYTFAQVPDLPTETPDMFPWDVVRAGMNP